MEKRLNKQAEATQAMNETLNKFIAIMGNQEVARSVTPPPPVSPPLETNTLQASQPSRVKLGIPSNFDGDRVQGCAFLTSCELYIQFKPFCILFTLSFSLCRLLKRDFSLY
jgi:hypothetical protein